MALTDLLLCEFKPAEFRNLACDHSDLAPHVRARLGERMLAADRRLFDLGRRKAMGRIAQLMLELAGRLRARGLSDGATFEFPVRQDDLADALGLTPEHVNRTLAELRRMGALEVADGRATIVDADLLATIAEDE